MTEVDTIKREKKYTDKNQNVKRREVKVIKEVCCCKLSLHRNGETATKLPLHRVMKSSIPIFVKESW